MFPKMNLGETNPQRCRSNYGEGRYFMPTYITLGKWTQKGFEKVKESAVRLDAFKKVIQSSGGKLKDFYMVMGQYDMVIITEAPDDESVAKTMLTSGSKGNVSTMTFRAFTEEEYRKIMAALP